MSWRDTQDSYLKQLKRKRSGKVVIINLIIQIWELCFKMWENRRLILHKGNADLSADETKAIEKAARAEFMIGKDNLPSDYFNIFRGSVTSNLSKPIYV